MKLSVKFYQVIWFALLSFSITSCLESSTKMCDCNPNKKIINEEMIKGYAQEYSYFPGDTVKIFVHSLDSFYDFDLVYNSYKVDTILQFKNIKSQTQNYNECSFKTGCNWELSFSFPLPKNLKSGYYSLQLYAKNRKSYIPLIIKSNIKKDILCLASTNTWQAYNKWGGASFYANSITKECDRSSIVNSKRPMNIKHNNTGKLKYSGHLFRAELGLINWLEREAFDFNTLTDTDIFNNPDLLLNYKVVILNTHSEYWSEKSLLGLKSFQAKGGHLIYLGANGLYWKVTIKDNEMECIKNKKNHSHDDSQGGEWRKLESPYFEEDIIGVSYTRAGYNTFTPYMVLEPTHWIFDNTGLKKGDLFGNSLNREYASGHETDKITEHSPKGIILLARGLNKEALDEMGKKDVDKNGGANFVYFEKESGAKVVSTGSVTSGASMLIDTTMSQIMTNIINNFKQ